MCAFRAPSSGRRSISAATSRKWTPAANQFGGTQTADRLVITIGKFGVTDIFDTNKYAHDPRSDFMNWSVIDAGTFDYAADAWGFSYGGSRRMVSGRLGGARRHLRPVDRAQQRRTRSDLPAVSAGRRNRASLRAVGAARQDRRHRIFDPRPDGHVCRRHCIGQADRHAPPTSRLFANIAAAPA